MRFLLRLVVLGFAGLGMYKAWELMEPKITDMRQRAAGAREKIEPALRDAADTLQTATKDAAETITDATRDAASADGDENASGRDPMSRPNASPTPKVATQL